MDVEDSHVGVSPKPSALNNPSVNNVSDDNDSSHPEKPIEGVPNDHYSQGLRFVLLAGAALVSVFF